MKNLYLSLTILTAGTIFLATPDTYAQFTFSPSTTLLKNQALNSMTYDSISVTNNSTGALSLNWELISADSISGTYFDFCASGNCFVGIPDTGSFPDIAPSQYGYIGMHFWTGSVPVTCIAKVRVYDQNNTAMGDTVTFVLNAGANGILDHNYTNFQPLIYPNPSNGMIYIEDHENWVNSTSLFNEQGIMLFSCRNSTNLVDLTEFPSGIYYLEVITRDGNACQQVIVRK